MAATAYKMRKASDKEVAVMLTQGFIDQSQDAISTLIYTIIKNFIGDPRTQSMNLRCPTMYDYRLYKNLFMLK
ncbi:hypothetical protein HN873_012418, partial [Arachis hypogaea]